jgi:uncharacterized protein (TIGR03067 family)
MLAHALLLVAAGTLLAPDTPTDEAKKELERLQGTWVATVTANGQKISLICTGDKYVQKVGDMTVEEGTHKLDPTKKPKTMDITVKEGEYKGKLQLAIYELDGDVLRLCANEAGDKNRPTEFSTTKEGGGRMLIVLRREKKEKDK